MTRHKSLSLYESFPQWALKSDTRARSASVSTQSEFIAKNEGIVTHIMWTSNCQDSAVWRQRRDFLCYIRATLKVQTSQQRTW
jgi:hypothetical protein